MIDTVSQPQLSLFFGQLLHSIGQFSSCNCEKAQPTIQKVFDATLVHNLFHEIISPDLDQLMFSTHFNDKLLVFA